MRAPSRWIDNAGRRRCPRHPSPDRIASPDAGSPAATHSIRPEHRTTMTRDDTDPGRRESVRGERRRLDWAMRVKRATVPIAEVMRLTSH
jgi:hypothetical protein